MPVKSMYVEQHAPQTPGAHKPPWSSCENVDSDSLGLGRSLRICIYIKQSVDKHLFEWQGSRVKSFNHFHLYLCIYKFAKVIENIVHIGDHGGKIVLLKLNSLINTLLQKYM